MENKRVANNRAWRREQVERVAQVCYDLHAALGVKWGDDPYAAIGKLKDTALSALTAIEKHNKVFWPERPIDPSDLTALHKHDAELRKPLVDLLSRANECLRHTEYKDTIVPEIDNALVKEGK